MSLFGQKRDLRRNSRLFEFFREPENPCTPKYTRIFRTPKETSKIHQILAVLGNDIIYQILAVLGNDDIHQNYDFLRELSLSTQTGAFLLVFLLRASQ